LTIASKTDDALYLPFENSVSLSIKDGLAYSFGIDCIRHSKYTCLIRSGRRRLSIWYFEDRTSLAMRKGTEVEGVDVKTIYARRQVSRYPGLINGRCDAQRRFVIFRETPDHDLVIFPVPARGLEISI
jgi:hypothetical protein